MKLSVTLASLVVLCLFMASCSDDDSSHPIGPAHAKVDTIYVDVSNGGPEDGSAAGPYNSVTEAIAAAKAGDMLIIAAGEYNANETFPLELKPGLTLQGVDSSSTLIMGALRDSSQGDSRPIVLRQLRIGQFSFLRDSAQTYPAATNIISRCRILGDVRIDHEGGHHFKFDSCYCYGDIRFIHGPGDSRDVVSHCDVHGVVFFHNGAASTTGGLHQITISNNIYGSVFYGSGDGAVDSVCSNNISQGSIQYLSAASDACITHNNIGEGQIRDGSWVGEQLIAYNNVISSGDLIHSDSACIWSSGASATIAHNNINASGGMGGIRANSGSPTNIDYNNINVSGTGVALYTISAEGHVTHNNVTGGSMGLYDASAASLVEYNLISHCTIGVRASGAARYQHNTILNCLGDGMILHGAAGPVSENSVSDNAGAGIRITLSGTDLGGGHDGGPGGNAIADNGSWDIVNETADTIWAKYNYWSHTDSLEIESTDIYDNDDDGSKGPVIFMPISQ